MSFIAYSLIVSNVHSYKYLTTNIIHKSYASIIANKHVIMIGKNLRWLQIYICTFALI